MGTFPRKLHQHRRGSRRSPVRTTSAPTSSPGSVDGVAARAEDAHVDDVVAHAEDVVRDAWFRALHGECDYTGAEMQAASARCDVARRNLAAALLGRDPMEIAVAYADLEGRLVSARIAARAYGQARETLDWELSVANRQAGDRFFDEYAGYVSYAEPGWMPGRPDESASVQGPRRTVRSLLTLGWLSQHVVYSLVRLAAGRRL
jgi:hypothetical protein